MLPQERKASRQSHNQHIPGRVVISSQAGHLDKLEGEAGVKSVVKQSLGTDLQADPIHPYLPDVYVPGKPTWVKATLQGSSVDFNNASAAQTTFQSYLASKGNLTRRYKFDKAKATQASQPDKPQEHLAAENLASKLNSPSTSPVAGFDITPDHIFTHTAAQPADSPADIPARPYSPVENKTAEQFFKSQPFWNTIGANETQRAGFTTKGQGVTVVIFDTAPTAKDGTPALDKINPKLVDYYISMKEVLALPDTTKKDVYNRKDFYSVSRVRPDPKVDWDRPAGIDIDHDLMQPYHGLLIASLVRELAPQATIILMEVLNDRGETSGSNLTEAMDYILFLKDKKAMVGGKRVVEDKLVFNLSLGYASSLDEDVEVVYMLQACERAAENGALVVAAAGNDSYYLHPRNPEEPAAYGYYCDNKAVFDQVIAVAATAKPGEYMLYSNQGNLAAPGMDLLMDTGDDNPPSGATRYIYWAGTSFAAPLVAASAALLLSKGVDVKNVKQRLWDGATKPTKWSQVPELNVAASV